MATEMIERCDICGEDTHHLSFNGGTRVYRGKFKESGWFWKGSEDKPPKGDIAICSECWFAVRRAVQEARDARAASTTTTDVVSQKEPV